MYKILAQLAFCFSIVSLGAAPLQVTVDPEVILGDAERIGINLGTWTTWGSEQLSRNVLMNPGFEGYVDRVIVITSEADKTSFSDEANWGYDDDYWKGATFEVRSGSSQGALGKVAHSMRKGPNGLPQYVAEKPVPALEAKDVITLTKFGNEDPVPIWWIDDKSKERVHVDPTEKRPLSTGTQSLVLEPKPEAAAEINYYLDAITDRAGKLLPVKGKWRFVIWLKSDRIDDSVHVQFRRINGSQPFFDKAFPATSEWVEHTIDFDAQDKGEAQTLQLKISATGSGGKVWLDDVFLGPVEEDNKTNFRLEVISMLQKLKPSYIRDTQGQLGDTFQNRIADIYARKATSTRAFAGARSLSTAYSIADLLQLCQTVKANPWIVVPPTFSDEEALLLGQYLGQHANKSLFSSVIVEFGNENWNYVFRSTGIPNARQHGIVAEKVFQQIKQGAGSEVALRMVVNGQHAAPETTKAFAQSTPSVDTIAIAPYFFTDMNSDTSSQQNLAALFQNDGGLMKQTVELLKPMQKKLAVYEVNLHTSKGSAKGTDRDAYVAGQAAGSALAKRLMEGMLLGIQPEIVFSLSQFDSDTEGQGKVKLWGISRDLGATNRMRPQGLAMSMLNAVIGGQLHAAQTEAASIVAVAFKQGNHWKGAAVNASDAPKEVAWVFPEGVLPSVLLTLHAKSPLDTNEESENVTVVPAALEKTENSVHFTIPAWGFVVLNHEDDAA